MRKKNMSPRELEELGEGLVRDYLKRTKRWNALSIDIEGFITEYLGLDVRYERFAEDDPGKIGYLSDGVMPLMVYRSGRPQPVVFPKGTVVVDKYLLKSDESGRRRFTLAHEAAHEILDRLAPDEEKGSFRNDFDPEIDYTIRELRQMFSLNERQADRLAAAILMPRFQIEKALKKYRGGVPVRCYGSEIIPQEDKTSIQKMADALGVSYSAMLIQLRDLNMIEYRPVEEYISEMFGRHIEYR